MTHELKTWPQFFEQVLSGAKTFELRKQDRNFVPGDFLNLKEYSFANSEYSGREITVKVTYVLNNASSFGLMDGYVIMGISKSPQPDELTAIKAEHAEMLAILKEVSEMCGCVNLSSYNQMKEAVTGAVEICDSLISKIDKK